MESPSQLGPAAFEPLLLGAAVATALALALALLALRRRRGVVGPVLAREGGSAFFRRIWITLACVVCVGIALHWSELEVGPLVLATALLATASLALSPSERDACVGQGGVARGWDVRAFREVEEWRLTGEHLRWRIGLRWMACHVPLSEHAALRERLNANCGERESQFRD
ncbi:MAG: hypothetical protein NTV21_15175 [Planctomycetota bacterium]|nr:hypothetical protein [Planctomycetota bacterium]